MNCQFWLLGLGPLDYMLQKLLNCLDFQKKNLTKSIPDEGYTRKICVLVFSDWSPSCLYSICSVCRGCWLSVMYIIHCFMFCCFCLLSCWLSVMYITFAVFVYIAFVVYVCLSWWLSFRYIIVFYVFVCYDSWPLGYLFWGSLTVRIVGCLLWLPMVLLVLCCVWLLADDSMLCFLFGYWFLSVFVCKADHCSSIFGCLIILCRTPLMTFSSQKTFKLLDLKIFWLWPYLLKVIPETCQPH